MVFLITHKIEAHDINEQEDLRLAEYIIKKDNEENMCFYRR